MALRNISKTNFIFINQYQNVANFVPKDFYGLSGESPLEIEQLKELEEKCYQLDHINFLLQFLNQYICSAATTIANAGDSVFIGF